MYQDTHIHLHDIKIKSEIDRFLTAARAAGFRRFFACAITPADWPIIKTFAEQSDIIIPFFGIHPWFVDMAETGWQDKLKSYLEFPLAGVGETGMDKSRKNIDFDVQKKIFAAQLQIAQKTHKPFIVHSVRAWGEIIDLIKIHASGIPFVAHAFNASQEIMREIVKMGGYLSISVKQFSKPDVIFQDVFRSAPLDRILLETDFPYQVKWTTPEDYIKAVHLGYEIAAAWKGLSLEDFQKAIYDNGTVFTNRALAR